MLYILEGLIPSQKNSVLQTLKMYICNYSIVQQASKWYIDCFQLQTLGPIDQIFDYWL